MPGYSLQRLFSNIDFFALSDTGRVRLNNEDVCLADLDVHLFAVCDGMGGVAGGEIAAGLAAATLLREIRHHQIDNAPGRTLVQAVHVANRAVFLYAKEHADLQGMGTTLVALQVAPNGAEVHLAHVGDSRCYRLRAGVLDRLTRDHTFVEEQLHLGAMSPAEADASPWRNVLTRVVGSQPEVEPELLQADALPGDLYLLCSDGLTHMVPDPALLDILLRAEQFSLEAIAHTLVSAANAAGGDDNVTVVLLRL